MKIDHIGYAVADIEAGIKTLETLGFVFEPPIEDESRKVKLAFGTLDGYRVELVAPMSADSPVSRLLKTAGPTPYHICYSSADLDAEIQELRKHRIKTLIPPTPAIAFGGRRVVFMYSLAIGTFEIVETD